MTRVSFSTHFDVPAEELFAFHMNAENLAKISPPVPPFKMLSEPKVSAEGDEQVFRLGYGKLGVNWHARLTRVEPPALIEDTQERGPFLRWRHQHRVAPDGNGSRLTDVVSFRAIPTVVGEALEYVLVRPGLWAMFFWRHRRTKQLLREQAGGR